MAWSGGHWQRCSNARHRNKTSIETAYHLLRVALSLERLNGVVRSAGRLFDRRATNPPRCATDQHEQTQKSTAHRNV
jgi:hypothetical protein